MVNIFMVPINMCIYWYLRLCNDYYSVYKTTTVLITRGQLVMRFASSSGFYTKTEIQSTYFLLNPPLSATMGVRSVDLRV